MFLAFITGYLLGVVFYALFVFLLIRRSSVSGKAPKLWMLLVARWIVMPVLVAAGSYFAFGEIGQDTVYAVGGYAMSRLVRYIKVMMGVSASDDDLLDALR